MKILIPDFLLNPPLSNDSHQYHSYRPEEPIPAEHYDAQMLVLWGNNWRQLRLDLPQLQQLQLLQTLSAGYDHIQRGLPSSHRQLPLCSGIGLHDRTVAEYCLAMAFSLLRDLPSCWKLHQQRQWPKFDARSNRHINLLADMRVLICGFGSIGTTLATYLRPFTTNISGIARSAGERAGFPTYPWSHIQQLLAQTDLLVNLLPGGKDTDQIINADIFKSLPPQALFINAGRGSSVCEADLVTALQQGQIAAAAIDVVAHEPLAADSPLWQVPNLLLTPHIAASAPEGWAKLVQSNADRFIHHQALLNRVELVQLN